MAIRPDTQHSNRHTGYLAASGYGKSQALGQNPDIPAKGARVLMWDPDEDYRATRFTDRKKFVRAVSACIRSGKGFRLAWSGTGDVDTFEWFCQVVWAALDGEHLTYLIIDELSTVQPSSGKATPAFGELCRRGRKYGLIMHWCSQRSEEISKTVFTQTQSYWIGYPNDTCPPGGVAKLARIARCHVDDLYALQPLQYYQKKGTEVKKVVLKGKKIN